MLLKNYNDIGLCNGSQGVVVGFDESSGYPIVRFRTHKHKHKQLDDMIIKKEEWTFHRGGTKAEAKRIQFPLLLAAVSRSHVRSQRARK